MFLSHQKKSKKKWPIAVICLVILVVIVGFLGTKYIQKFSPSVYIAERIIEKYVEPKNSEIFKLVPQILGFNSPKTYLILLLNNTELRPAGGFIGSYAVVRVENGKINVLVIEGTETLDKKTPTDFKIEPPKPITDYLGVDRWYFRDSNWDPDFSESVKTAMYLYKGEGGQYADNIDAVIAITPTVVERILELTGPITVQGITFTYSNVTEKLEHEVEYGYYDKGISFQDRKQLLKPFMIELLHKVKSEMFSNYDQYLQLFSSLAREKHILIDPLNLENVRSSVEKFGWTGNMDKTDSDYIMWVDANLAALKTDHAMERDLTYSIQKQETGNYIAHAKMHYTHNGSFDWRTTRYLTYVRIFVPDEAELVSVSGAGKKSETLTPEKVDFGVLRDKKWFGVFVSIEPGDQRDVEFTYILPKKITKQIDDELYTLIVQKQAGSIDNGLTLDLNFDKTIKEAEPAEQQDFWGNNSYTLQTDLTLDRTFAIQF